MSRAPRMSIGIDFGETNVKVVCLESGVSGQQLVAHGFFRRAETNRLKEIFASDILQRGRIRINFEDPSIKIRRVEVPAVPDNELPEVIKWALKDVVATHVEDYIYRHHPLPKKIASSKVPYLVYAVQRKALEDHLRYVKELGLSHPDVVEPNASALFGSFTRTLPADVSQFFVLLDFGSATTLFAAMSGQALVFSRPLAGISGNALTKQISRDLGVSEEDAERFKMDPERVPPEQRTLFKNTIGHFLTRTVTEIQRSMEACAAQYPDVKPKKCFLFGGGAKLTNLRDHLCEALKQNIDFFDPFQDIGMGQVLVNALEGKRHYYGLAMGLALE